MLSLRRPLLSAVLALIVSASAALSIPSSLIKNLQPNPINTTNPSLPAPPSHPQNVTYTPWPSQPYQIHLHPHSAFPDLTIVRAGAFHGIRGVSVPGLQAFLHEFGRNLEREYPIPGGLPRLAQQESIDILSYTVWRIEIIEGFFGHRMPTEVALGALDVMARELGSHGPAALYFTIREGIMAYSYGIMDISKLGGRALNRSLNGGSSDF